MGYEQDPEPTAFQANEHIEHVDPGGGIQHADYLVRNEQFHLEQQRPGDQETLLLTAGQVGEGTCSRHRRG